ncbi:tyrosine-protein phosphatase non-receptor type 23-like isoform X1 [Bubalus bubalis]|uniref:tyrosine-protein phosphatase non-receptor type 23-like isoform X1 n=1 Tax=Bubalus bubalis TaxID=89462 RepID=UPI001E1B76CA|nr:tyrosine-protein phosphatase non-receptor type 23-like isoform X1 [Bubalus bubalis]
MMSLPGNRTQQNPEPGYPGLHSGKEPPARSLAAKMFCCLPLPRGRGLGRAHRQSVWERARHWLRHPPRGLCPFARRKRKNFPLDVADEGDTPSTSPRQGLDHHPPAHEPQCRLQVSVPTEGSAQLGMKRKQGRPVAQTPPRTHPGAQSQAPTELSTSGSNPEPREPLPLRQQEDLDPSTAEHRALALTFKFNQAPLPRPVPKEVVTPGAGPRDPLTGDRDLRFPLPKTPGQLGTGQHPEKIRSLCLHPQPQAPMSHPFRENLHLHLYLYLLGLWQENPCPGMSYHLCRESLPWLLPKTQTPTMTHPPLQGERAPALDRDPDPFLETPRPGARLTLQPPSLSDSRGCHQLAPHPGEIEFPSPELILIWFVFSFPVIFFFFFMALLICFC